MEKVRPWCGQPSDRGRLKNRTGARREVLRSACLSRSVRLHSTASVSCRSRTCATRCVRSPCLKKSKCSPYSITERRVPELIPVLGSQPAGDVSHKPAGRLPLLSARPTITPATIKRAATNFATW